MEKQSNSAKKTNTVLITKEQEISQAQKDENPVLQMLQMAMTNSEVNLEKMEKIMQMVERHEDKLSFKAYNRDMALMQGEIPAIENNSEIKVGGQVRSKYTNYEGIMKVVQPILSKFGFSVSFNPISKDGLLTVDCMISHRDGHIEKSSLSLPFDTSGSKNSVQAIGSSMSYAKRYALCLKLNIATGGEDNDGNTVEPPARDIQELGKLIGNASNINELQTLWDSFTKEEKRLSKDGVNVRKSELNLKAKA